MTVADMHRPTGMWREPWDGVASLWRRPSKAEREESANRR